MGIPLNPKTLRIQAVHIILLKWPYFSRTAEKTSGKMQLKNPKKSHAFRKRNKFSLNDGSSIFWWVFSLMLIYIALLICKIPRILYSLKFWWLYVIQMISNIVYLFKCIIPYFISERCPKYSKWWSATVTVTLTKSTYSEPLCNRQQIQQLI